MYYLLQCLLNYFATDNIYQQYIVMPSIDEMTNKFE